MTSNKELDYYTFDISKKIELGSPNVRIATIKRLIRGSQLFDGFGVNIKIIKEMIKEGIVEIKEYHREQYVGLTKEYREKLARGDQNSLNISEK